MLKLEWQEEARLDLIAIIEYISDDNPRAAQELKDEIELKVSRLISRPLLYKKGRIAGTREMLVRKNYIVVYAVQNQGVSVLRVLHTSQKWP
ncbi:type II toxin-antitoxin system RelE/ParE family toxin [Desulfococcaceae bacterium OttesenSCG-928-F15]|nr:type II toxin-antitoxin system RelE/ParE family toxin [Desulfococcaceae bacterium OttesenSCG-928-F15]